MFCLWVLWLPIFCLPLPTYAVDREHHKAMYLGRLSNYVTWPSMAIQPESKTFNLCVLGEDTFKGFLQSLYTEKSIKDKPVKIYYFNNIENIPNCHLLFISISKRKAVSKILNFVKDKPILTISETRGFTGKKGIIQFYMQAQRVRLKINNQAAISQGLKISSKLLAIANVIK
ncbi:MAG: YfiR family protein [Methylococcales bacterium]|nr:YfiR family protein [Methylococcales bacterium]